MAHNAKLPDVLHLLTWNIQLGIPAHSQQHYLSSLWKHVFPSRQHLLHLGSIADILRRFDLVALQEVDGGSFRTQFVEQAHYLAHQADFPWHWQLPTRNLKPAMCHGNGLLACTKPRRAHGYPLPSKIPGRAVQVAQFGQGDQRFTLANVHLSLTRSARHQQLQYLSRILPHTRCIIVGDFNCSAKDVFEIQAFEKAGFQCVSQEGLTWPSWKPKDGLDHIFVTSDIDVMKCEPLQVKGSDHLPIELVFRP